MLNVSNCQNGQNWERENSDFVGPTRRVKTFKRAAFDDHGMQMHLMKVTNIKNVLTFDNMYPWSEPLSKSILKQHN